MESLRDKIENVRLALMMDNGVLAKIENNTYEVVMYVADDSNYTVGQTFALQDTFSEMVYDLKKPVAFNDISTLPMYKSHPAVAQANLHSYIGVPIMKNNTLWGTLNFSSKSPREIPIVGEEIKLVKELAQSFSECD